MLSSALEGLLDPTPDLARRFTAGNRSTVVIDEARGFIAEHFDVGIDEASIMLRAIAIAQQQPVVAVAVALMDRSIDVAQLAPLRPGPPAASVGDVDPVADAGGALQES
jgi:hypothetical protein